ncbi:MAG: helix-turn-helix domain-containing protein [Actinomycetia bacterium]|nr:helix-turn-helix domain-containing protein [Actinomycetes bacterium]MCP4959564.1 helix-turn-helix domain-containing protein [Actinomycetes bacterium]
MRENKHARDSDEPYDLVPRSTGRVLDLLEFVLASPSCNLTSAAAAAGLTPTTALRHLRALEARGYVDRDELGCFSAGPTMLRLGATLTDTGPVEHLIALAQPLLDSIAVQSGESTYLAIADGKAATYVAAAESPRTIRHVGRVGQNLPLEGTAVGAALAAPGCTIVRTGAVEPDITAVSRAVSIPGRLGVAISVVGPSHRLDDDECTRVGITLENATRTLSAGAGQDSNVVAS